MSQIISSLLSFFVPAEALAGWNDKISSINVDANLPDSTVSQVIYTLLMYLLAIFTALSVLSFAVYGIMFLFGGANKDLADSARKGVTYSILGIIVGLSGYIVVRFITEVLQGSFYLYF